MEDATTSHAETSRRCAASVLGRIFGQVNPGVRYRLWDGSEGKIGRPDGTWTLVVRDRESFVRSFGNSNTQALAEAFVDKGLDVDGDLFAALRIANQLEHLELSWLDKLGIWLDLKRI